MKKYQKIIKDNIDLMSETEDTLMRVIDEPDYYDAVIYEGHLRSIFLASGALEVIDADYDYSKLSARTAHVFANLLTAFASSPKELNISSHDLVMRCFELSREINDNLLYHSRRTPLFDN